MSTMRLKITSSGSGEVLALLELDRAILVEQVLKDLARSTEAPFRAYTLLHNDRPLLPTECLRDIFEGDEATLTAVALPMLKIPCNLDVLAAAFIPNSDDLLMVTKGNITAVKDEEIPALGDNDPTGILWFWRLFRAEQWSFLSASLVARRSPCLSNNALMELWAEEKDKEEFESYSPWTKEEVEEQKRTGIIKWGKKFVDQAGLYLRIHDESHAVFTWNQSDILGGCGNVDRLDLATGEVTNLGRIWDAWDVTTDSSGRIFYTSCYDGTDVHLLKDTTLLQPSSEKPTPTFIVSQTVGLGFNLCFDATLKVLVTSSRDGAFFVISPPGEGRLDVGEGLPSIRPPGDDHTPGDKTAPWDTVKILEPVTWQKENPCSLATDLAIATRKRILKAKTT
ncbi:unnamed protein product [Durusdinium trenchii]|uniref:Ubiquitin-like domain-containing protein n=4 Tax=Durusdinium trenchii TaxID=1381693 RepID=A0ABP0R4W7_9DINO